MTHIAGGLRKQLNSALETGPDSLPGPELYRTTLEQITKKLMDLLPEYSDEIDRITTSLTNSDFDNNETFTNSAAETLVNFTLQHFTFAQIEEISRRGKKMLNRLVEYHIDQDEVMLHIPLTFLDNGIEFRTLFVEALRVLAEKIVNDQNLQNIKNISVNSWIVYRTPDKFLEAMGFSDIERYEKDHTGSAEMSKEVLLEKYGSF